MLAFCTVASSLALSLCDVIFRLISVCILIKFLIQHRGISESIEFCEQRQSIATAQCFEGSQVQRVHDVSRKISGEPLVIFDSVKADKFFIFVSANSCFSGIYCKNSDVYKRRVAELRSQRAAAKKQAQMAEKVRTQGAERCSL